VRAAIYLRTARDDGLQVTEKQRHLCLRHVEDAGLQLAGEYNDDEYPGTSVGPALEDALRAVEAGDVDVLVVVDLSRLGRDAAVAETVLSRLDGAGVAVHEARTGRVHEAGDAQSALLRGPWTGGLA
jgi:DNA invertase Pin-like site-specific DNA recombinase